MSPVSQWISTVSMNRFYDQCYLIECAYHIISKYCCSFTNLLNHDDGSIPYYLVQKVKIAVEYGRILLNTRYRPFQQQLRLLGSFDYIDRFQYEGLCIHWNTIKTETRIVEMYFNQISLLIYPVVSSNALLSLHAVENGNVSALTKINALIQSLVGHDETTVCSSPPPRSSSLLKSSTRLLNTDKASVDYFSEEELGLFIVNSIIEPLFQDDTNTVGNDAGGSEKRVNGLFAGSKVVIEEDSAAIAKRNVPGEKSHGENDEFQVNRITKEHDFQLVASDGGVLANDFYSFMDNNLFPMDDKLLSEILAVNPFESLSFASKSGNNSFDASKSNKVIHDGCTQSRFIVSRDEHGDKDRHRKEETSNFRLRYDRHRRQIGPRNKYQKRNATFNFDKKYPFEFVNKKSVESLTALKQSFV